jgi:thiazole/oxazole-forming peptide maturase SagD family component
MKVLNALHARITAVLNDHADEASLVAALTNEHRAGDVKAAIHQLRTLGILDAQQLRWSSERVTPALFGLLTSRCQVLELPTNDDPFHVFLALAADDGSVSAGGVACGFTPAEGLGACLGEAAETASMECQDTDQLLRMPWREACATGIHPRDLLHFSDAQIEANQGPAPFDEAADVHWVEASDIISGAIRLLPAACIYSDHSRRHPTEQFAVADSNGCAVGRTRDEATLAALCELVERDATGIWWYGQHQRPTARVQTKTFDHVNSWLRGHGRELWLLDLRTDIDIPVTVAVSASERGAQVLLGFGAHPDAAEAERKALRELVQMEYGALLTGWEADGPLGDWSEAVCLESQPQLSAGESLATSQPSSVVRPHGANLLAHVVSALTAVGLAPLRVDLTHVELSLPCVRMVVPGLRHYHPRFAAGRLFQVPEQLGWCAAGRREQDLNSVALTI